MISTQPLATSILWYYLKELGTILGTLSMEDYVDSFVRIWTVRHCNKLLNTRAV